MQDEGILSSFFHLMKHISFSCTTLLGLWYIAFLGQAAPTNLEKILNLQKRALRLIHFKPFRFHAVPLFKLSNVLPLNFLYFNSICLIMHDVSNNVTPPKVSKLFTYSSKVRHHNTRLSAVGNFYTKHSRNWPYEELLFKNWCKNMELYSRQ